MKLQSRYLLAWLILILTLASGCNFLGGERPQPKVGDAVWTVAADGQDRLQLVERWGVRWVGDRATLKQRPWSGKRGAQVVLVISGARPEEVPSKDAAVNIVGAVETTVLDVQNQGVRVRGLHLDLREIDGASTNTDQLESTASLLRRVRGLLDPTLELSVATPSLDVEILKQEVATLGAEVDWVLIDLYGQHHLAEDRPLLWDLEEGLDRMRVARAAEIPSGVWSEPTARWT